MAQTESSSPVGPTFREAFDGYFEMKEQQLSNPKHAAQWRSTMETYVFPAIGKRPITDITAAEISDILKPIWNDKPETAKRVLQRMRAVFEAAIVRGDRPTAAPTTGIKTVLGARQRAGQSHHAALSMPRCPRSCINSINRRACWRRGSPSNASFSRPPAAAKSAKRPGMSLIRMRGFLLDPLPSGLHR